MSKQINCTVVGHATDIPYLTVDNGHIYHGTFESASRVIFTLADTEPPWGATIFYGGKAERYVIPELPGSYEGPVLTYTSALSRLQVDGNQFRNYTWAMMTGFCDYQKFLNGENIRPQLQQAKDLGANGRRVLGMMAFITNFNPTSYGQSYYDRLPAFVELLAQYGQRVHFDVFADNQIYKLGLDHWVRTCDKLRPLESVVIGAGNEWPKNGFDPFSLPYPGVLSSQGSALADSAPPMPGWGVRMWHGRRDSKKVYLSADDMWYVGVGAEIINDKLIFYAPQTAAVHDEPIGFAEIDIEGRRSTNPRLAQSLMLTGRGFGAGATFHSEDGIFSRLLGPQQQTCARAFFDAQG